jgi:hypothetical protein
MTRLSLRLRPYRMAVRATLVMAFTGISVAILLADPPANACCDPTGGSNHCNATGCADNSYCVDRVTEAIAGCCGVGNGRVDCLQVGGGPQRAFCVSCNPPSTRRCGASCPAPAPTCNPSPETLMNCTADQAFWDWELCSCNYSPIVVQLTNTAPYQLTNPTNGVLFDINGDGTKERSAWTVPSVTQGLLALDRNGNGTIDSAAELFGTLTVLATGATATSGFEALAELEAGTPTADGVMDAADPAYGTLRIWMDNNHNGVSEPTELIGLAQAGVKAISLAYRRVDRVDGNGNRLAFEGKIRLQTASGERAQRIYDVFFSIDPTPHE